MATTRALHLVVLAAFISIPTSAAADTCFSVEIHSPQSLPATVLKTIATEVDAIWSPYGVRIVSSPDAGTACDRIDGSFDVLVERQLSRVVTTDRVVLGSTRLQLTSIDHSPIHIDYDAVSETLKRLPESRLVSLVGHQGIGSIEVGRAIGRVLAHEIGHVLLMAPNHQPSGLMRPSYRAADLIAIDHSSLTLSSGERARLTHREEALRACSDPAPPSYAPGVNRLSERARQR